LCDRAVSTLFHRSLAHGERGDVVSLEELGDPFFGELEGYSSASAAGEGEDLFAGKEGGVSCGLLLGYAWESGE